MDSMTDAQQGNVGGSSPPQHNGGSESDPLSGRYAWSLFDDADLLDSERNNDNNTQCGDGEKENAEIIVATINCSSSSNGIHTKRKHVSRTATGDTSSDSGSTNSTSQTVTDKPWASKNRTRLESNKRNKPPVEPKVPKEKEKPFAMVPTTWTAAFNTPVMRNPETMRIREILEIHARAQLAQDGKYEQISDSHHITVLDPPGPNARGYNPLHCFRMMASALNSGCFSELCGDINQFFSNGCQLHGNSVEPSFRDFLVGGQGGVISLFKGLMESCPDGQWDIENERMVTISQTRSDGTTEKVSAVLGHFSHRGRTNSLCCILLVFVDSCCVVLQQQWSPPYMRRWSRINTQRQRLWTHYSWNYSERDPKYIALMCLGSLSTFLGPIRQILLLEIRKRAPPPVETPFNPSTHISTLPARTLQSPA
jgi:hypothetical protein